MDYEKLHKETLLGLQKLVSEGRITVEIAKRICADFVAESEDERIRKWLFDKFNTKNEKFVEELDNYQGFVTRDQILAYLEKQKDITPIVVSNEDWNCQRAYSEGYQKGMAESNKQKPVEWSAYDKATIEYIIEDVKGLRDEETDEEVIETYDRELNLLQCINDSVKLCNYTNPAEWSEEDVERLAKNRANKSGTLKSEMIFYRQGVRDAFNYKSMRPHWKPSEEQISILGKVFAGCELNITERDSMVDLFYNLKQMI